MIHMAKSPPFPKKLRWFTTAVFAASVVALLIAVARTGLPKPMPLFLFGLLVVFSRNRDVALPGDVKVAATTMILIVLQSPCATMSLRHFA